MVLLQALKCTSGAIGWPLKMGGGGSFYSRVEKKGGGGHDVPYLIGQ